MLSFDALLVFFEVLASFTEALRTGESPGTQNMSLLVELAWVVTSSGLFSPELLTLSCMGFLTTPRSLVRQMEITSFY